jgi:hypothetical protein
VIALLLALAVAAAATPGAAPRLEVAWASLVIPDGAPVGHLRLRARFAGIPVDAEGGFVELTVDGSTRFANLRRTPSDPRLGVGTAAHHYAVRVDPTAGTLRAVESDVLPPGNGPIRVEFGAHGVRACTLIQPRRTGTTWSFDARRNRQTPCPAAPPAP